MKPAHSPESEAFVLSRFQTCTAELQRTVTHLQEVEREMSETIDQMRVEEHPHTRLLLADAIVESVRAALAELDGHAASRPGQRRAAAL